MVSTTLATLTLRVGLVDCSGFTRVSIFCTQIRVQRRKNHTLDHSTRLLYFVDTLVTNITDCESFRRWVMYLIYRGSEK